MIAVVSSRPPRCDFTFDEDAALQQQPRQAVLLVQRGEDFVRLARRPPPVAPRPRTSPRVTEAKRNQPVSVAIAANSGIAISGVSVDAERIDRLQHEPAGRFRRRYP